MSVEPTQADTETTALIKRVDGPLPPYAVDTLEAPAGAEHPVTVHTMLEPVVAAAAATPAPVPAPTAAAVVMPAAATEVITCPECGTVAEVTLNRRESMDFCRTCDYPLFWTPAKVVRDPLSSTDESLRRLPGTVGRATVASLACPFCAEPNALSAQTCVRCGRPMHPVAEPEPAPVVIAPPPPPPPAEPEPEAKVSWWVWALLALGAAALITLVVLIATHTIG